MMWGWIVAVVFFIVGTEVIYFSNREDHANFLFDKIVSMFGGIIFTAFFYGLPYLVASSDNNFSVFYWFYGIIASIVIFIGVNYLISKKLG